MILHFYGTKETTLKTNFFRPSIYVQWKFVDVTQGKPRKNGKAYIWILLLELGTE
jgi:hypothetical protein